MRSVFLLYRNEYVRLQKLFGVFSLLLLFNASSFAQTKTAPVATKLPPPPKSFMMCEVMPAADVSAKAPFTIPLVSVEYWPVKTIKTGCAYKFKSDDEQASVAIALTDMGSDKNAITSYRNAYKASKDLWEEEPVSAIVLKDTGFFSGKDECGIKLHLGKYILDINFKGQFDTVTAEQKKMAGIVLAEMVMDRLKYLWKPTPTGN